MDTVPPRTGDPLALLLERVRSGDLEPEDASRALRELPFTNLGFARVDTHREARQGAPEAVLAEGKTPAEVVAIMEALHEGGASSTLATRADAACLEAIVEAFEDAEIHERARCAWLVRERPDPRGRVVVLSAGTSDAHAVHEARIRAELIGVDVDVYEDCGVAGLHRLLAVVPEIREADCVVVCAGMDAALASVVGGLVAVPIIAVPTSTGYGATFGGAAALHSMLVSCAAGVAVVNIDDGFGAGTIAARIARRAAGADAA
jgi:NCAIR mutase (PurE)-related protein